MKKRYALAAGLLALLLTACPAPSAGDLSVENLKGRPRIDEIFDLNQVTNITVTLDVTEWNKFLDDYDQLSYNEEIVQASLSIKAYGKTESFDKVGFGLRGNSSRRRAEGSLHQPHDPVNPEWRHAHFKLDLNHYVPGQDYKGVSKLILKWFKNDGTRVKEIYSYDLFRQFGVLTAPRASYAHLTIQIREADGSLTVAPYGAYEMIEGLNDEYLTARQQNGTFQDAGGFLFKCVGGADLVPPTFGIQYVIGVERVQLPPLPSEIYRYDLKTRKADLVQAKAVFMDFVDKLNNLNDADFAAWIPTVMDIDTFLKTYAVNVAVGMWDDYWFMANNFYLYFEPTGKVWFIPYDYDNSLGTGSMGWFDPGLRSVINWGEGAERPLTMRLLSIPQYLDKYRTYLRQLVDPNRDLFDPDKSLARVHGWRSLIRSAALNDVTLNTQSANLDSDSPTWDEDSPPGWGKLTPYKVLTGDDNELGPAPNYFKVRKKFILATVDDPLTPPNDWTAPNFVRETPRWYFPGGDTVGYRFDLPSRGDAMIMAIDHSLGLPDPTAAQIFQGLDGNGNPVATTQIRRGAQVIKPKLNQGVIYLSGLAANTTYDLYAITLSADGHLNGGTYSDGGAYVAKTSMTTGPGAFQAVSHAGGIWTFKFFYPKAGSLNQAAITRVLLRGDFNNWLHVDFPDGTFADSWGVAQAEQPAANYWGKWTMTYDAPTGLWSLDVPDADLYGPAGSTVRTLIDQGKDIRYATYIWGADEPYHSQDQWTRNIQSPDIELDDSFNNFVPGIAPAPAP